MSTSTATRAVGYLAAASTVPYLALKVAWLSGATIGFTDAALAVDPSLRIANAITGAMDLVVVGLALALTHSWGRRLPSWLLLIPIWVGTGFLVPITLTLLPAAATGGLMPAESSPFEPWLQPLVYGGFAWQGVLLGIAFVLHARARWSEVLADGGAAGRLTQPRPAQRVLVGGVAGLAVAVGVLRFVAAVGVPSAAQVRIGVTHGLLALAEPDRIRLRAGRMAMAMVGITELAERRSPSALSSG
ncbi:MAG: hypothetical protein ACRDRH_16270 [Pseudonocardia sp.]